VLETLEARLLLSADLSPIADNNAVGVATPVISATQPVDAVNTGETTIVDASPSSILLTPVPDGAPIAMHIHAHLSIVINGQTQLIPAGIGVEDNGDLPIHTHDDSGTLHVESPVAQEFHLQDFFTVWGQTFTSQGILGHQVDASHPLTMTVNGQASTAFGSLVLHDQDNIVIQYGDLPTTAATPAVWTNFMDYAPGTTALIGGSGFAPNEKVDLQVLHIDGTPNTDASHTPWTVVADATGAISTSWLVDSVDALGSRLQLNAVGEASQTTAQATFTDSTPHPFWIFGHNPNSIDDANNYVALGVNALEPDIEYIPDDGGLVVRHDTTIFSSSHDLIPYLQNLSNLANSHNLALVVFDVKSDAANHPGAALELANDIQTYVLNNSPQLRVILSVASTDDANAFFPSLKGTPFVDSRSFGFQIDGEDDPLGEVNHLHDLLGANAQIGFGDGTAGCCGRSAPLVGPFFGPNTPPALQQAVWVRTAFGTLNMVSYGFAVTGTDTMKMLIDSGVDGLIPSDFLAEFGKLYPQDTLDALALVNAHYGGTYLATSADDPFSVSGAQNGVPTGSRQGYGLEVQTATSTGAGTDANITFTLHGQLGDASVTVDSSWSKEMENGDTNYVFIPSGDLGHLKSVTVTQDGTGGLWGDPLGLGSKWDLDWIKVRSAAYMGVGPYPTPGAPNSSQHEYFADFGGQTIDDNTPVAVALRSGIPFLATLTNGDLVLNMGPHASDRVEGDLTDGDESFTVHHVSTQPDGSETVTVSAFGMAAQTFVGVKQIDADGGAGNDSLTVDGAFTIPIHYDGGTGFNSLTLSGTTARTSDIYTVGPNPGQGTSVITGPAGTETVFFENLAPVLDTVVASSLTVNATAADNAISYSVGSVSANGKVSIDSQEPIEFANKTTLTINAGAGQDTISVNNSSTPTGLTGITINGDDPASGDTLIVTGTGSAVGVNTSTNTITGATGASGAVPISYSGIENLNLATGIGDLTLTTTGADDTAVVTPGQTGGANSGTVSSNGAVPQIAFVNSGSLTVNLADGNDALVVNGSSNADAVAVDGTAVSIAGRNKVTYSGVEALTVNGNAGSDTFTVTPSPATTMFIDGGDPLAALPGDQLKISAGGAQVTFNAGPQTDEGSFVVGADQPVSFDHIESFGVSGSGPAVINGTNGPDAITVIARDSSFDAAADGVRDFTVSVNNGPNLLFIDVPTLTINALSGSDQVTLETPAPNPVGPWNVDVTVNGGAPAADTDQLIVETPGTAAESVVYTPSAADSGKLDLTSLTSPVTMTGIEALSYDGQGDNDSLTVVGTIGDDTIVHTPGANDQAGSFQVNSLLALSYQNMGSGGTLAVNGAGGTDTLVYNGTVANDIFTIGTSGQVNLNSRLVVNTTNVQNLTLNGLAGDDTFTLVPAISDSVYTTINLNGGGQASATGDRVNLVGAKTGDDTIYVSGQVVTLGGKTINGSGIEDIRLDALGGNNAIIYNGVLGVSENIKVSSSGVVGGGQISVPGVTLVDFSNVQKIDVNGNAPTPTETDTLTFAGTNAVDTFNINLAAAGSNADPILKLQNGATTLLTLRNYTNFNTLNVLGLDGEDTFNVSTAATIPVSPTLSGRNLFVDGGQPTGKKKSTDNLNVLYKGNRPSIIHSTATQNPQAGIVDLNYGTARFVVQYNDIEQVVIRKS
jgi:hypothetical protein